MRISKHKLNRLDDDDNSTAEVLWCDAESARSTLKPPINQDGTVSLGIHSGDW